MNIKILIVFLLTLPFLTPVYAQEKDTSAVNADTLSSESKDVWENWDDDWNNFKDNKWEDISSHMFDFNVHGAPTIDLFYGASKINLKSINDKFANPGMVELKLGYTKNKSVHVSDFISKYKFSYFHLSNFTPDISGKKNDIDIKTNSWRFGFGWASGYSYDLGCGVAITPYYQYSVDWTRLNFQSAVSSREDGYTAGLFNKSFRFGNSFQGGIQFKLMNNLGIDAAYERSIVFPRHLVWKWGGSVLLESIGQSLVDEFVDKVLDSSPYAAPIVSFILKNALSYGMYELRQDKMNWPFDTVAPMAFDQFKIGLTFVF